MNKILLTIVIVLAVGLAGAAAWAWMTKNNLTETQGELANAHSQIASLTTELVQTKIDLKDTEATLTSTEDELQDTTIELVKTQSVLTSTSQQLDSTNSELADTKVKLTDTDNKLSETTNELLDAKTELIIAAGELSSAKAEAASTKSQLTETQSELASVEIELTDTKDRNTVLEGTLEGLGITISASAECDDAELIDNPQAKNPTWLELRNFLLQDTTEQHQYILNEYDCSQYSRDVHNNAEAAGIRAAVVHTTFFEDSTGHALNAFLTTDYGLVYVDCTEAPDRIAFVEKGEALKEVEPTYITDWNIRDYYWWGSLWRSVGHFYLVGDSVVTSIEIFW
jgi:peptidoglycan hydrolase CwlO-like protein